MDTTTRNVMAAAVLAVAAGCGQPALIDRTQPNYIRKADLTEGVWYVKETVVDTGVTPGAAALVGGGGRMEKVRWQVQEDLLVGYRAYEVVPGADPRVDRARSRIGEVVLADGRPYLGNPVFAYRIESHFDRQRQYNPSTGEQGNVLVEDMSDRPWYQREFMRVDWSTNRIQNAESTCTSGVPYGGCVDTALNVRFVTREDQRPEDQAVVMERDGEGKLTYLDWTTQAIADPPSIRYPGYGNIPFCFFNATVDCESSDVRVRTSVRRVDEARVKDYEPLIYDDRLMVKFGLFRRSAYTYSRDFGYTYSGTQFFAMRHNLWQRAKDDTGATIPVTRRALRPVVYHLTGNTPAALLPALTRTEATLAGLDPDETVEASWDRAFRRAVAVPRGLEPAEVPQMFFVCTSPVQPGDPAECGAPGTVARLGDLRFNLVTYVDQQVGGLLGMGPSSMDPETGEVVHAVANQYGATIDTWAGASQQVMDVLSGEVTLSQLVAGEDVRDYVKANLNPTDPRRPATGPWTSTQPLTARDGPVGTYARTTGRLRTLQEAWRSTTGDTLPLAREDRRQVVAGLLAKNPGLEEELLQLPEVKLATRTMTTSAGFRARLDSDPAFYRQVARDILFGIDPVEQEKERLRRLADPSVGCLYEVNYEDEDYVAVARRKLSVQRQLEARYTQQGHPSCAAAATCTATEARALARRDVYDEIRREAYRSVAEHEIGHTVGLRHNFIASADALNYQDGYWDLRKETIGVRVGGKRVLAVTPQNMVDAARLNQKQIDEGLFEYAYSSIMDYGARVNANNKGIGKYDEAAVLFAYAGGYEPGWVEVFNQTRRDYQSPTLSVPVDNQSTVFTARGAHVEIPLAHVEHYTPVSTFYTDRFHYTTLPFHFADPQPSFEAMLDQGIARMSSRSYRKWSEMAGHYQRIEAAVKDYTLSVRGLYENEYSRARLIINAAGGGDIPVEVPYMFCTDGDIGANLMCNPNDQGADVYEMTSKWLERFEETYVFSNFRRDRLSYSPAAVASGKFNRYLGYIPNVYQQWLFNIYYLAKYYVLTPEEIDKYYGLGDPLWQNYWTMAVVDSTNLLMQQLSIPSVGYHGKRADGAWEYVAGQDPRHRRLDASAESALVSRLKSPAGGGYLDVLYIPRGEGRSMFTIFDDQGFDSFYRIDEAGHFWDVYAAMLALTTSDTNFLGVDRGADALRYSLPYYLTFNRELGPLFNAYWTQDSRYFSPRVGKQVDGTGEVELPVFLRAEDYVQGFVYPPAPPPPTDFAGAAMVMSPAVPVTTWSSRFYAQVWSMAFFTTNYNLEFANLNQVFRLGSGEGLTPSPGFDVVSFADPFGGGYSYAAFTRTGATTGLPAGAATVTRAVQLKARWDQALGSGQPVEGKTAAQWEAEVREIVRTLEMMRALYDIFGRAL